MCLRLIGALLMGLPIGLLQLFRSCPPLPREVSGGGGGEKLCLLSVPVSVYMVEVGGGGGGGCKSTRMNEQVPYKKSRGKNDFA